MLYDAEHCRFAAFLREALPQTAQLAPLFLLIPLQMPAMTHLTTALRERALPAALITLIFALIAYRMRAVTFGGTVAGALISFVLYVGGGYGAFIVLATVFALTAVTTPLRRAYKRRLGLAESRRGRKVWQVLANLSVAGALVIAALFLWHGPLLLAAVAALGEAASDTVSSECGQALARHVYMITGFQRASVGTDGAISLIGTVAGAAAALLVALVAARTTLIPHQWVLPAAAAALLGNFFDSLLGAIIQRRGWLNNSAVNLLSTAAAAGMALMFLL
jgi:uncharacterized protein (TIGR00297 family)